MRFTITKKLFVILSALFCLTLTGCTNEQNEAERKAAETSTSVYVSAEDFRKAAEISVLVAAASAYPEYTYFGIHSTFIKYDSAIETYYFKCEYYCYRDGYKYYEMDFFVAINNETTQVKEVRK